MTQSIKTLIERLEKASGPDRVLDFEISIEVLGDRKWPTFDKFGRVLNPDALASEYLALYRDVIDADDQDFDFPRYTAYIDSALTLVQDGWRWRVERYNTDETKCHAELAQVGQIRDFGIGIKCRAQADAKHPAIALCIAALKSREAQT